MIKKIFLLLLLVFLLQSCFYTHRARRIQVSEIDVPKGGGLSNYVFEFDGNAQRFQQRTMSFFGIKENYLPSSFTTLAIYPKEPLTVFLYFNSDKDKYVDLFNSWFWQTIGLKSDDENITKNIRYNYIHIQVTDNLGNDVLVEKSMRNKAVMERLNKYQRLIN